MYSSGPETTGKHNRSTLRGNVHRQLGRNLTYHVMHELGVEIVKGTYGPTNPFPIEAYLCNKLSVSRSVLREAIKMLTAKGLLGSRPRQGTWVQSPESWNLLDPDVLGWLLEQKFSTQLLLEFLEMRLAVEPIAAGLAAVRAKPAAVSQIGAALMRMQRAEEGKEDPLQSDIDFHVAVLQASGNRYMARLRDLVGAALRTSIRLTNQMKGVRLASVADHQKVYDAIVAKDATGATEAMRMLIFEAIALVERMAWHEE